ncbi:hypothetical protein BDZ88DRAFT_148908 [Geranomyces variabilis]|nr:hypothetical protein BDZ88DRAFT_148908 [Geranomyces variabilis]
MVRGEPRHARRWTWTFLHNRRESSTAGQCPCLGVSRFHFAMPSLEAGTGAKGCANASLLSAYEIMNHSQASLRRKAERERQAQMDRQQAQHQAQQRELQRHWQIKSQQEIQRESQAAYKDLVTGVRQCPHCKKLFERLTGCNEMTCAECGLYWDWNAAKQGC